MNPIRIMFTLFLAALLLSPAPAPLGAQEAAVEEATDKEVAPDAVEKAEAEAPAETKATTYAVITLSGAIVEVADPIAAAFGESFTTLRQVTDSIDRAAADEEIAGIAGTIRRRLG